jgi:site-specific DNA-methyltransferase (adenine-specific)
MQRNPQHNPDILTCLANLSSDEVFTPPQLANQMLDLLPSEIWRSKDTKFLDPFTKSGVFLREIARRLNEGLEEEIPDQQKRIDHILKNQIFGIAITEITSLLTRRSLYCSKKADGKYSIAGSLKTSDGNVRFKRMKHSWQGDKCKWCGASKSEYDRDLSLETHAYEFIHTDKPEEIFNMKFDVIVGNPPYQLSDGGGRDSGAVPLYHHFVQQAVKLSPRFVSMIIPARWYSGGKGLDDFRAEMLKDRRIAQLHDFPETADCFPGVNIRGGVCYFLWAKDHKGPCSVFNYKNGKLLSQTKRPLKQGTSDVLIRYNEGITIVEKVLAKKEPTYESKVSARKPFGLDSNFAGFKKAADKRHSIALYRFGPNGFVSNSDIQKNGDLIDKLKVLVSKASPGGDSYPHQIISEPIIAPVPSACTETYLIVDTPKSLKEAKHLVGYMKTQFFRFMMSLVKNTQNISRSAFMFVPIQDLSEEWTDQKLYKKYGITAEQQNFINSLIRPME